MLDFNAWNDNKFTNAVEADEERVNRELHVPTSHPAVVPNISGQSAAIRAAAIEEVSNDVSEPAVRPSSSKTFRQIALPAFDLVELATDAGWGLLMRHYSNRVQSL